MVNLGPQLVQLMNGYRNLLSAGSASSCRQSAQVAVSAAIRVLRRPVGTLATIAKNAVPAGAIAVAVTRSTLASGGASLISAPRNSRTAAGGPSTSANTPSMSLPTSPARPRRVASAYTKGRKPTPWTMPSTRMAVRTTGVTEPGESGASVRDLLDRDFELDGDLVLELERAEEPRVRREAEVSLPDGGAAQVPAGGGADDLEAQRPRRAAHGERALDRAPCGRAGS